MNYAAVALDCYMSVSHLLIERRKRVKEKCRVSLLFWSLMCKKQSPLFLLTNVLSCHFCQWKAPKMTTVGPCVVKARMIHSVEFKLI